MADHAYVFPTPRSDTHTHRSDTASPDIQQQQQHHHQQQQHTMRLKRYSCKFPGCTKDFSTSGHAARHARLHQNHKPFACDQCHMSFYRNDNLTQHKRSHNASSSPSATTSPTLPNVEENPIRHQQQQPRSVSAGADQTQFIQQQPPFLLLLLGSSSGSNAAAAAATTAAAASVESVGPSGLREYSPPLSPASKTKTKTGTRKLSKTSVEFLLE